VYLRAQALRELSRICSPVSRKVSPNASTLITSYPELTNFTVGTTPVDKGLSQLTNLTRPIDIRLKVKGMKTLYDSFQDYVAVKTLSGEHGYQTGKFGLQDARAAVTFQSFPPVLHLQLKRYEYDTQRDAIVRVRIASSPGAWLGFNFTLKP